MKAKEFCRILILDYCLCPCTRKQPFRGRPNQVIYGRFETISDQEICFFLDEIQDFCFFPKDLIRYEVTTKWSVQDD